MRWFLLTALVCWTGVLAPAQVSPRLPEQVYDAQGRLLLSAPGNNQAAGVSAAGLGRAYSWLQDEGQLYLLKYTDTGLLQEKSRYDRLGTLLENEVSSYADAILVKRITTEIATRRVILRDYDQAGRIITEEIQVAGSRISLNRFAYTDSGKMARKIVVEERTPELTIDYSYDTHDELLQETWHQSDRLIKHVVYQSPGVYAVSHFDNGQLFAKDFYENGTRKKQEIYRSGQVIRQRIFE